MSLVTGLVLLFGARQAATWCLTREARRQRVVEDAGAGGLVGVLWVAYLSLLSVAAYRLASVCPGYWEWAGGCLVGAGTALRLRALAVLGRHYATGIKRYEGQVVVTTGPYALLRHPLTTGLTLEMLGLAIIGGGGPALFLGGWVAVVAYNRREERALAGWFGAEYTQVARARWDAVDLVLPLASEIVGRGRPLVVRAAAWPAALLSRSAIAWRRVERVVPSPLRARSAAAGGRSGAPSAG